MSDKTTQLKNEYQVIGVMSGSSLDGLDVCLTKINPKNPEDFKIARAETLEIPNDLKIRLSNSPSLSSLDLLTLDIEYGQWVGSALSNWIDKPHEIDVIGIHGHTVFHRPDLKISVQIGSGSMISQTTGVAVVDRFREKDVQLGGQGAPLVPFGEKHLFPNIKSFINLGGIANISIHHENVKAWDIAPCNQVLNHFAKMLGVPYDKGGELAKKGNVHSDWINYLNSVEYFSLNPPKSLANQFTEVVLKNAPENALDGLTTYTHFLAEILSEEINTHSQSKEVLFTGGGAKNLYLMELVQSRLGDTFKIASTTDELIEYKEALIFGYLGLQRLLNQPNILSETTGSSKDTCSGVLHLP